MDENQLYPTNPWANHPQVQQQHQQRQQHQPNKQRSKHQHHRVRDLQSTNNTNPSNSVVQPQGHLVIGHSFSQNFASNFSQQQQQHNRKVTQLQQLPQQQHHHLTVNPYHVSNLNQQQSLHSPSAQETHRRRLGERQKYSKTEIERCS